MGLSMSREKLEAYVQLAVIWVLVNCVCLYYVHSLAIGPQYYSSPPFDFWDTWMDKTTGWPMEHIIIPLIFAGVFWTTIDPCVWGSWDKLFQGVVRETVGVDVGPIIETTVI